jgi:antitoxin MazE
VLCYNNVQASERNITMLTTLRKLGNSRGVIIPKPLLAQVGLTDEAEIKVENGAIVLRPAKLAPRAGWAEACRALAAHDDEGLAWPEFANEGDSALEW